MLWIADHPDAGGAPALLAPCWLMLIATCAWGRGCLGALLGSRCFVALGEASYCMYLLHWPVWYWLTALAGLPYIAPANGPVADLPLLFAYTLLTVGVALLAYRTVEQPARRAIRRACA